MGTNNRQRRAAKQKKRAGRPTGRVSPPLGTPNTEHPPKAPFDEWSTYAAVDVQVTLFVSTIARGQVNDDELLRHAESLVSRVAPASWPVIQSVVGDLLALLVDGVTAGGWSPADLGQLIVRSGAPRHLPTLLTVLYDEARRNPSRRSAWLVALKDLGADPRTRFATTDELASGLLVAALISSAPLLDAASLPGVAADDAAPHPKLARVRALLAKAESTTFDEEADLLTAKAQELISRYALGRLLDDGPAHDGGSAMVARRIWLDAPYVRAKSALVHEVAAANSARAALCERHAFSVVVGASHDLEAIELLVTSLQVQASRAMLRHGRLRRGNGTSRTRSFRQAFLVAYAGRIGQRLRTANDAVMAEDADRYLPVLRDHAARASAAFDAFVPHTTARPTTVSNGEGYAAGLAAADLALLDINGELAG